MKNDKIRKLQKTFEFSDDIPIVTKKYKYYIHPNSNEVYIECDKWKDTIKIGLKHLIDENDEYVCILDPDTFYIKIKKGLDTLRLEIPTFIKEDIISDFDSLMTDEFIDNLCKKENDRIAKEKELEEKENQRLINEFFGIIQED